MSAALVKELRERTGLGLLECKRALAAAGGDVEAVVAAVMALGAFVQAHADRLIELSDLVIIRAIRIKIVLTVPFTHIRDSAIES